MASTAATVNKNKATHSGTCQACGRFQKLPYNLLSKHGYTVEWGFFSGTCPGSHNQPFEISCDLIERFIEDAKANLAEGREQIAELEETPAEVTTAWVHEYRSGNHAVKGGYFWKQVEIIATTKEYESYSGAPSTLTTFSYIREDGKSEKLETYNYHMTLAEAVAYFNARYIKGELQPRCSRLNDYIRWQTQRVENWKPAELTPVSGK